MDDRRLDDQVAFSRDPVPAWCDRREVVVPPGRGLQFDEDEWRDALVLVTRGVVELECRSGSRRRFGRGALLWLTGLPLRALHTCGQEPAVLVALSRRGDDDR